MIQRKKKIKRAKIKVINKKHIVDKINFLIISMNAVDCMSDRMVFRIVKSKHVDNIGFTNAKTDKRN